MDLTKAFDIIITCLLCSEMTETDLPGQVIAPIHFMGKNTYLCTSYGGQLRDEWNVKNVLRQEGLSTGILFNFYLIEVVSDISELHARCTLNCSKFKILVYADDLVLNASRAFQFLFYDPTSKLYRLSLQANVEKTCNIVFSHSK